MKKFIFSAIAAIGLLLSPSCSDENEALSGSGNEALVSFSVNLADGISTKAISDGTKATHLIVEVYEAGAAANADPVHRITDGVLTNLKGSVTFSLVKGKKYDLIFWAQTQAADATNPYYDVSNLRSISVDYDVDSNIEKRDAFLYVEKNFSVNGPFERAVTLKRPFAQVNFMVPAEDIEKAIDAGFDFATAETGVTFKNLATTLNTLTNTVANEGEKTFGQAAILFKSNISNGTIGTTANKLSIGGTDYYYLATNYILVNAAPSADERALVHATLNITDGSSNTINKINVSNLPVQRNYRTNIYGHLLSADGRFTVEIDNSFEGPNTNVEATATVDNVADITTKIEAGAREITCTADITEDVPINIPKVFETDGIDTDSKVVIRFEKDAGNHTITFQYGGGDKEAPTYIDVNANGGSWVYEDLQSSTVTLHGDEINDVTAATAQNTLIIAEGLTVKKSITATKGGVKILGKVLGEGLEANQAAITMADGNQGDLEIQGQVSGGIKSNSAYTEVIITPSATVTGNVEAQNNITVQGSVTGNVKTSGDNATVVIEGTGTIGGSASGSTVEAPVDSDVTGITTFTIGTADELIAFAAKVNVGGNTFNGKTIKLTNDIDLNNADWTPIGADADQAQYNFQGTFDGQNHTIRNLKVNQVQGYHAAGLFGSLAGTAKNFMIDRAEISNLSTGVQTTNGTAVVAGSLYSAAEGFNGTIENVTVKNVKVSANRYVAGIAGYVYGSIKNCHVENAELISTPDNLTGDYDNGDKAGGIAGYMSGNGYVDGCSVSGVTVTAYRDLGGIVGYGSSQNVTNCRVSELTLIQDYSQNYKELATKARIGAIIGGETPVHGNYSLGEGQVDEENSNKTIYTVTEDNSHE